MTPGKMAKLLALPTFDIPFPLTPALSLGEREPVSLRLCKLAARGCPRRGQ